MNSSMGVYLDYAAATPMHPAVLAAMEPYFSEEFYNPSSPYAPAVKVRREYEAAKQSLAETFGAKGDELIITAGATESINLAFFWCKGHIVSSEIEHPAVLEAIKRTDHTLLKPDKKGRITPEAVAAALTPQTQLVSIALANNELGTIQPLRKIAAVIAEEKQKRAGEGNTTPLLFHTDASQGFNVLDVHVSRLGVDMLTLNSGKLYGPKQVALLWVKSSSHLEPLIVGGGQERGLRSGTENVAGLMGFSVAAALAANERDGEYKRLTTLRDALQVKLLAANPGAIVNGDQHHRLANYLHISFPGIDAERIIFMLESEGVFVATGSACAANKHTASHVLTALGMEETMINGSLRITLGAQTSEVAVNSAAEKINAALARERARMGTW